MVTREAKKILPTMKIDVKTETDLAFQKCNATIVKLNDVETKFGEKVVATMNSEKLGDFSIFVNNYSMEKLIAAYGNDDENFIGKVVTLSKEKDSNFNKEMIVLNPVA